MPDCIDLPDRYFDCHCIRSGLNDMSGRAITWRVTAENNPYLRGANECRGVLTQIRLHPGRGRGHTTRFAGGAVPPCIP